MGRLHHILPGRGLALLSIAAAVVLAGCGSGTQLVTGPGPIIGVQSKTPHASQKLGFPTVATKNTTRVGGSDPVADAAAVALAVYPSSGTGTHPSAVVLAPSSDWQAALAASVLMAPPVRAPILLSGQGSLPSATTDALSQLAPTGSGSAGGAQLIRVGDDLPRPGGLHVTTIHGHDPYALTAAIDTFATAVKGRPSSNVVIASGDDPAYAMPAAGWAAESGEAVLFVTRDGIPPVTQQALRAHGHPNIYVLGPTSVIPDRILTALGAFGRVKRVGASGPASNSVAFAIYRDPHCTNGQPCAHVPGSFGWAMRSPGHGYVLLNANRPLDAAAAAPLSSSGDYGPQLLVENASTLPASVLNFFLDYATPGYTQQGPTAAVYNHGWMIGDRGAISPAIQAQVDGLLEVVPQK